MPILKLPKTEKAPTRATRKSIIQKTGPIIGALSTKGRGGNMSFKSQTGNIPKRKQIASRGLIKPKMNL